MCGIACIFAPGIGKSGFAAIAAMGSCIRHRGPDDEGLVFFSHDGNKITKYGGPDTPSAVYLSQYRYKSDEPFRGDVPSDTVCALGHRRLSIVDTSCAGHQPMCSDDERFWITYNGEVYNFIEIRRELSQLGIAFHSGTDTEVILKAYQTWGEECLRRFNGMFSFVIYDKKEQRIFAARDRFGVKPMYYWISPAGFIAIASEIKQFTVLPGWRPTLNGQRACDFLLWGHMDHSQETLFSNVLQVRGGEKLICNLNTWSAPVITSWYSLPQRTFQGKFEDAKEEFRTLLHDAVRLRLRADVEVGSCLSGGLDSSSIVCLANQLLRQSNAAQNQRTFSSCSNIARFDERNYIDAVASHCGLKPHHCYPSLDELFCRRNDLVWHQDEPYGSTSVFAQWEVFKLANAHQVKVMLDGQGADEQLAGYHLFFTSYFFELFRSLRWTNYFAEVASACRIHGRSSLTKALHPFVPQPLKKSLRSFFGNPSTNASWLDVDRLKAQATAPFGNCARLTVNELSRLQLNASNLPMLLHWEDRNSMAHSVESRTPFIDYRLVEFSMSLPSSFKLSKGVTKRVLRGAMTDVLPEVVVKRMDKMAFVTAEEEWMKRSRPDVFRAAVNEAIECSNGIIKPSARQLVENMISGRHPFHFLIWRIVSFGDWIKRFSIEVKQ